MFDVGLSELALIALVALLVLGPEKLPRAARTVGLYVRKAKQSWYSVRGEIEREFAADELKRSLKRAGDSVREAAQEMHADLTATTAMISKSEAPATPARDEPPAA